MANRLYTIGYGNKSLGDLCERARRYGVTVLVDVRSAPFSKHRPEFCYPKLGELIQEQGLSYAYLGDRLGGKPIDPDLYVNGVPDYESMRQLRAYSEALDECRCTSDRGEVLALLCACSDAGQCHRGRLLAPSLVDRGWTVEHIDLEGRLQPDSEIQARIRGVQMSLFS